MTATKWRGKGTGLLLMLLGAAAVGGGWNRASAQSFTTLYSFEEANGVFPRAGLIADASGNLYGTTERGGAHSRGTVFKVTPSGTATVLYSFGSVAGDGAHPRASLIADASGNLYGTTAYGGSYGGGTVFKITPSGTGTVLYAFGGVAGDGILPYANLIADASGNFYGTTDSGGAHNRGTVFKVTPFGAGTVLYSFGASAGDGAYPDGGLITDASGNLYGTTFSGGAQGYGTVFKLTPAGAATVLYSFGSLAGDGHAPSGGLIADASGNLYGTTLYGGAHSFGTVFKLTPAGVQTVLYTFNGSDGGYPWSTLIADATGNLYGTTEAGGSNGDGAVFKLTPSGTLTVLHSFTGLNGRLPYAGLMADLSGNLYGTTYAGGTLGLGTVFKLTLSAGFTGVPGQPNCTAQTLSFMAKQYGGLAAAARALGYSSASALQNAVTAYCGR